MKVVCYHDGFAWVWDFCQNKWLIDVVNSGGPPSPHEKSPGEPPCAVLLLVKGQHDKSD